SLELDQFVSGFPEWAENLAEFGAGAIASVFRGGTNAHDSIRYRGKRALNPHMAALFSHPRFRTFEFTWDLSPKSAKESDDLRNILYQFKYHMHPSLRNPDRTINANRWFTYPNNFQIAFYTPGDPGDFLF